MRLTREGRILAGLFASVLAVALLWATGTLILASERPRRITIIYTAETLGALEPCG